MKWGINWDAIRRIARILKWPAVILLILGGGLVIPLVLWKIVVALGVDVSNGTAGDYLGGVSSWAIQAITIALLFAIWRSERRDDRATAFNDGLLRLIELYVAERDRVNSQRPGESSGYFAYNVNQRAGDFSRATTHEAKQVLARHWIDEDYRQVNAWRLALFRVSMYVREAQVSPEEKHAAMKLLRVSCDRYEQQVFFMLLHERDPGSVTAKHFFDHEFFRFADMAKNPHLNKVWNDRPNEWKDDSP